jgi:hypothetical protein
MFRKQFTEVQDAWILAHAIVDTVREPLIVLDQDLRVVAASQSFYLTFKVDANATQGKLLYDPVVIVIGVGIEIFDAVGMRSSSFGQIRIVAAIGMVDVVGTTKIAIE